jgi:hypothetical protein
VHPAGDGEEQSASGDHQPMKRGAEKPHGNSAAGMLSRLSRRGGGPWQRIHRFEIRPRLMLSQESSPVASR